MSRTVQILLLSLLMGFATLSLVGPPKPPPAWAQSEEEANQPATLPGDLQSEQVRPLSIPLIGPEPYQDKFDKTVPLDDQVHVKLGTYNEREWYYRIDNGSGEKINSIFLVIPDRIYDSRIVPEVPWYWTERRERGVGAWHDRWVVSYFSTDPAWLLTRGKWMNVALSSSRELLSHGRRASVIFGANPNANIVYPWDRLFFPMNAPVTTGKAPQKQVEVPYPALSFQPLPRRDVTFPKALEDQSITLRTVGQGLHFGKVFQMTVRCPQPQILTLPRGLVMVPTLKEFDVMIIGRSERLIMTPNDTATIGVMGYSISYGRRAPPPRIVLHNLDYHFSNDLPPRQLEAYRKILDRARNYTPSLYTPLGANYYDTVVQWAIWRTGRLLESNPLSIRDIEKDLTQVFFYRYSPKGSIRIYLQPLQIYELAKKIWSDTDGLLRDDVPEPIP